MQPQHSVRPIGCNVSCNISIAVSLVPWLWEKMGVVDCIERSLDSINIKFNPLKPNSSNYYTLPYSYNLPHLISDIRALWHLALSARVSEIRNGRLGFMVLNIGSVTVWWHWALRGQQFDYINIKTFSAVTSFNLQSIPISSGEITALHISTKLQLHRNCAVT